MLRLFHYWDQSPFLKKQMVKFMRTMLFVSLLSFNLLFTGCSKEKTYVFEGEKHLSNLKMLTNGGKNAETYFSFDEEKLIFQSSSGEYQCDQIFTMNIEGLGKKMVSTGLGRTTCSYFLPGDPTILYASTHLADPKCPSPPDQSNGYVWKLYDTFDIFIANVDGTDLERITFNKTFDGFPMFTRDGKRLVFASNRFNVKKGDTNIFWQTGRTEIIFK